jgi:hypothetical protein
MRDVRPKSAQLAERIMDGRPIARRKQAAVSPISIRAKMRRKSLILEHSVTAIGGSWVSADLSISAAAQMALHKETTQMTVKYHESL